MKEIKIPGWDMGPVYFFDSIGSTSDYLRELALKGSRPGTVVWARKQTEGRGRRGKKWFSPPGGLYFSVLFHSPQMIEPSFSLVAAGSIIRVLGEKIGLELKIKWPNDIYRKSSKVGGIICENLSGKLIVGIGLNIDPINNSKIDSDYSPGSLSELKAYPSEEVVGLILSELDKDFKSFQEEGFAYFLEEQKAHSNLMGRTVRINCSVGRVVNYGSRGQLILENSEGFLREFWQGTVVLLEEG